MDSIGFNDLFYQFFKPKIKQKKKESLAVGWASYLYIYIYGTKTTKVNR